MNGKFGIKYDGKDFTIDDEGVYEEELPIKHNVRMIGAMLCNLMEAEDRDEMRQHAYNVRDQAQRLIDRLNEPW
ncbi:hypothetical protein [Gordonibacter sp. Marseille-P4307]|uniref:hypothetical protein n=1 Tax=Gordonibacter sp. Marseille-P4307 TaxID=2161815 RepID=UPI000F54A358|nr:hypothetical protein [Gordonibacter sp. Marseille-P4307]